MNNLTKENEYAELATEMSTGQKAENKKQQLLYRAEKLGDLMCILGEHLQMTGYQHLNERLGIAFYELKEEIKGAEK